MVRVDLHWGVSLSLNSHTCIHRGHLPSNMSELSFSLPHEQGSDWAAVFMHRHDFQDFLSFKGSHQAQQEVLTFIVAHSECI